MKELASLGNEHIIFLKSLFGLHHSFTQNVHMQLKKPVVCAKE
jgi:hypothetical protein